MANGGRRARGAQAAPSSSSTFEVEAITNVRFAGRQNVEYLVQWKVPPGANPDDYEPTWEAEDNLEGCEDALRDFCVEWTRQYEAALKVCPRPPAQFSLPRIAPSATLTAFTPQAAKEKKEPLPMLSALLGLREVARDPGEMFSCGRCSPSDLFRSREMLLNELVAAMTSWSCGEQPEL